MSVSKNKLLPKTASPADTSFFDLSTYHICTSYAHYMHIICTLYAHYMHITCTLHAHYMHIICTVYAHYITLWCNLCSPCNLLMGQNKLPMFGHKKQQNGHPEEDVLLSQALEPFQLLATHWVNGEHPWLWPSIGKIMIIHGNWDELEQFTACKGLELRLRTFCRGFLAGRKQVSMLESSSTCFESHDWCVSWISPLLKTDLSPAIESTAQNTVRPAPTNSSQFPWDSWGSGSNLGYLK